jgi:hypothetical protein
VNANHYVVRADDAVSRRVLPRGMMSNLIVWRGGGHRTVRVRTGACSPRCGDDAKYCSVECLLNAATTKKQAAMTKKRPRKSVQPRPSPCE